MALSWYKKYLVAKIFALILLWGLGTAVEQSALKETPVWRSGLWVASTVVGVIGWVGVWNTASEIVPKHPTPKSLSFSSLWQWMLFFSSCIITKRSCDGGMNDLQKIVLAFVSFFLFLDAIEAAYTTHQWRKLVDQTNRSPTLPTHNHQD